MGLIDPGRSPDRHGRRSRRRLCRQPRRRLVSRVELRGRISSVRDQLRLLGIVVGFLIGIIASRTVGSGADPSFLRSLGVSQAILLSITAIVGVSARLLADVPPTINGDELMLAVEVRWPEGHATSPATLPGEPFLRLGSLSSNTLRASSRGPLWTEDAHLVDGRWVVPGAVDIFTTRGRFVLDAVLDSSTTHGFIIPLSGKPRKDDMKWTEWYPHARPGAPPLPNGFTYRYRVQKRTEPVRTESIGPFDVETIASYFFDERLDEQTVLATMAEFTIKHRGQPVTVEAKRPDSTATAGHLDVADGVAVFGGSQPALLAHFTDPEHPNGTCYVLTEESERLRSLHVPDCVYANASILTSDTRRVPEWRAQGASRPHQPHRVRDARGVHGRWERRGYAPARGARVQVPRELLDLPGCPAVRHLARRPQLRPVRQSLRRRQSDVRRRRRLRRKPQLPASGRQGRDALRHTRRHRPGVADAPLRVEKGSRRVDSLAERQGFVPIPYHGRWATTTSYWLEPAREPLRDAIMDFIVSEFKGERLPVESYAYEHPIRIDGETVNIAYGGSGNYVSVSLPRDATDRKRLETIVRRSTQCWRRASTIRYSENDPL